MILILGGAGFVGGHLLERMARGAEPVRCGVISETERQVVERAGIEPVWGDLRDRAALVRAMRGARAVINLVTLIHERQPGDFAAVMYHGVHNMILAARETGIPRIVHIGALAPRSAALEQRFGYLYWKNKGTELIESQDLDHTIFETSLVYGPGDQHFTAIALALKIFRFAAVPRNGSAEVRLQPISVGDLVTCILKALDDPGSLRRKFPLAGPENFRYRDLVEVIGNEIGVRPRIALLPELWVRSVLQVGGALLQYPPVTPELALLKDVDSVADSSATYEHFGIKPARVQQSIGFLRSVGLEELKAWRSAAPSHAVFGRRAGQFGLRA